MSGDCDPDGPPCTLLKALLSDGRRTWLARAATRNEALTGVRLQAFRAKRGELSCAELVTARSEVATSIPVIEEAITEERLGGRPVSRLSRTLLLANQLPTSLGEERIRRCGG